jgi:asparagine synthase (glutamine-hydrolysing)
MCGIAGVVALDGSSPAPSTVRQMTTLLRHRGPDADGMRVCGAAALGHTRLSIIDVSGGAQPMANADGTTWVTFNGEIYNFLELRVELEGRGHHFRTQSDTEVLLHAYEEYGPACVERFNGQFAFAIWNTRKQSLFLARDRFGKKPLFYARPTGAFVFASEIKAVLAHPGVSRQLDTRGLDQVLTFWCTAAPRTMFRDVAELPSGHWLMLERGVPRIERYWSPDFVPDDQPRREEEYAEELLALLVDAVKLRTVRSDVPVGAYVSGGLDSTAVASIVAQYTDQPVKTFSLAFEDAEFDESCYQRQVIEHLGLRDHHEVVCRANDIGEVFPEVIWHTEQPLVRTAPAPMLLLSRLVRQQGYKVVLTGEGADEVLGGYDIFKEAKIRRFCAEQPKSQRRSSLLKRLYPYMPALQNQSAAHLLSFFDARDTDLANPFFSHVPRWRMTAGIKNMWSDSMRAELSGYSAMDELQAQLPSQYGTWHPLFQAQHLETTGLLPGYILSSQGDRVQMANSVEGRCPFLDYRIAEFASRLPASLKMKVLNEKYILKRAVNGLIPPVVRTRPKQPYRSTDGPSFFDRETGRARFAWVEDALAPGAITRTGIFAPQAVAGLVMRARSGRPLCARDGMALVSVLSTQLLLNQFAEQLGRVA